MYMTSWAEVNSTSKQAHVNKSKLDHKSKIDQWRNPQSLDPLYTRIAQDLQAGRPLIVSAYYGMWHVRAKKPERNLNWGGRYGHAVMMKKSKKNKHVKKLYRYVNWKLVYEAQSTEMSKQNTLRTLVFTQKIRVPKAWRKYFTRSNNQKKIPRTMKVFLVMYAYESQEQAALDMVVNLRQNQDQIITFDDHTKIDVGQSQITGYFGHNFFYDYEQFEWDGFQQITGSVTQAKGVFAVGCKTARVPGFHTLITPNVHALLFSRTLMASEGYSTLALVDGILRAYSSEQLAKFANKTYKYFQKLERPHRKVGRPFVSHRYKMYPRANLLD